MEIIHAAVIVAKYVDIVGVKNVEDVHIVKHANVNIGYVTIAVIVIITAVV